MSLDRSLDELGSRACILATFGRHREAIELINATLWRYPDDKRLYNNRCCSYIQSRDFESALADATYLTENFPDFAKGHVRKGEVLTLMRRYAEAEREYRTALNLVDDQDVHVRYLQVQLLQIINSGFDQFSAWKALCETGSVQQSLRLLKTPYRNYEHVVNSNLYGEAYFKKIEEGSTHSEDDSADQLPEMMEKLEVNRGEERPQRAEKENLVGGKKKFPAKQDKSKKIIRRNKKKVLFLKSEEKSENILTVRNK
ncbi:UNVERIFIED_CONTAM: hypothetical protein PYX00_008052 [Menopon gallinae]|uniref:Uncharacterized protein n=1 Tax=Menopon gallinae TaxID=328185 RepID=A0AAW2HM76_9NEOP